MGGSVKAQELRDLLGLAAKLRNYADATGDPRYVDLFLQTAEALETRAQDKAALPAGYGERLDLSC